MNYNSQPAPGGNLGISSSLSVQQHPGIAVAGHSSDVQNSLDLLGNFTERKVMRSMSPNIIRHLQKKALSKFLWSPKYCSERITLSAENRSVFLEEDSYLFRSVVADRGFTEGIHYFEIIADA
jgi:hypothetical protein